MADAKTLIAAAATGLQEAAAQMDVELDAAAAAVVRANDDLSAANASLATVIADRDALAAKNAALTAQVADLQAQLAAAKPDPWAAVDKTGATEVTDAMQKLVANGDEVPVGTYLIDPLKSIKVPSGKTLDLTGCTILLKTNGSPKYRGICLEGAGSKLIGGTIIGDRDTHDYTTVASTHEWGLGVYVCGTDCVVDGTVAKNCTGDGIKVADGALRAVIRNADCDGNRRQGISVTKAVDTLIEDTTCRNTQGTSPQAGIDIEPNTGETAKNTTIRRCTLTGNGYGMNIQNERVDGVLVEDCQIIGNRSVGLHNHGGLNVVVKRGLIGRNGNRGLTCADGSTDVSGVIFELNSQNANPKPRLKPLVTDGLPRSVVNDASAQTPPAVVTAKGNIYK